MLRHMTAGYIESAVRYDDMDATGRRRALPSLTALVLAVVAGVVLALVIDIVRTGGPAGWLARHHLAPPYEARGERHDIGGRSLYLDCRGEGRPTVVLEAGSGADSATWSAVHDALAATTRTCAYDRAGRGRSDPIERRTLSHAAAELRALLSTAGEEPPFSSSAIPSEAPSAACSPTRTGTRWRAW